VNATASAGFFGEHERREIMPTYVYACDTCQVQFEKYQSFSEDALRTCPTCQSAVRRVMQPVGIAFKGSGWHINDYRATPKESSSTSDVTAAAPVAAPSDTTPVAPATTPAAPAAPAPAPAPAASKSTDA
jgi:putative FmdB family regulatory protein